MRDAQRYYSSLLRDEQRYAPSGDTRWRMRDTEEGLLQSAISLQRGYFRHHRKTERLRWRASVRSRADSQHRSMQRAAKTYLRRRTHACAARVRIKDKIRNAKCSR